MKKQVIKHIAFHKIHRIFILSGFVSAIIWLVFNGFNLWILFCLGNYEDLALSTLITSLIGISVSGFNSLYFNGLKTKLETKIWKLLSALVALYLFRYTTDSNFEQLYTRVFDSFEEFSLNYIMFWSVIVALFYIVFLSIKLVIEKASN